MAIDGFHSVTLTVDLLLSIVGQWHTEQYTEERLLKVLRKPYEHLEEYDSVRQQITDHLRRVMPGVPVRYINQGILPWGDSKHGCLMSNWVLSS